MKKKILCSTIIAMFAASGVFALGYSTVVKSKEQASYSKCAWESDPHGNKVVMKGKPGKNDTLFFHCPTYDFNVDMGPIEVKQLRILYDSRVRAEGKKFVVKSELAMISGNVQQSNSFTLKKCELDAGTMRFSFWSELKTTGKNRFVLEDSKANFSGNIIYIPEALYFQPTKDRSAIEIELIGDSILKAKGSVAIDDSVAEQPNFTFAFIFTEKEGKLPKMSIGGDLRIGGCELHLNIKNAPKAGVYPLIESLSKNAPKGKMRGVYINGKQVSLGTTVAAGGKDITLSLGSTDGKVSNDYILTVK